MRVMPLELPELLLQTSRRGEHAQSIVCRQDSSTALIELAGRGGEGMVVEGEQAIIETIEFGVVVIDLRPKACRFSLLLAVSGLLRSNACL